MAKLEKLIKLVGERVSLRPPQITDAHSIYEYARDEAISHFTTLPHPYKLEHAKKFIAKAHKDLKKHEAYALGIELNATTKIIGMVSLMDIDYKNKNAEIGYWLGKKYWGQGLSDEAVELIIQFGFDKLKLEKIWARVSAPNERSSKLLERSGFKCEGRIRKAVFKHKQYFDEFAYGLLKEEYRK